MKKGILYALNHFSWFQYKKCGRTTRTVKERISNMKTSLLGDIHIIYITNELIDCYFYEYLMKQILKNYRIKPNKEMFDICEDDIKMIFDFINELNTIFDSQENSTEFSGAPENKLKFIFLGDTEDKLNLYIQNQHHEYFKKRKYVKSETSSSDKPKKKKRKYLYVDTSY